jgi:release factor glutamine methyltransferase
VIVDRATATLAEHGIENPRVDAEWIVAHVAGVTRSELVAASHEVDEAEVWPLVQRRTLREPLAYVLGEWGFRRLTLRCDPRALVPRPETEVLVGRCLELLQGIDAPRVLDVGTGTGAIALALADEAGARVVATDVSEDALSLAGENATRTGLTVELVHGDSRDGLPPGPFDLVVANPPYVRAEEWEQLQPEVREWEPREALVDEGQSAAIVGGALDVLRAGGFLVLEVHERTARDVRGALEAAGYRDCRISRDLAGRDRVVEGIRNDGDVRHS